MTTFALYAKGLLADGAGWTSRILATGNITEATAATAIHTGWDNLWADVTAYFPTTSTLTQTFAATLGPTYRFVSATPTAETKAGTSASVTMPISTSPVISLRTASRTKSGNGRIFLPAAATNAIDTGASGKLLAAFQTACTSGGTALLAALTGAGLTPQLLNRVTLVLTPITSVNTGNLFRQQRRRQSKVTPTYA